MWRFSWVFVIPAFATNAFFKYFPRKHIGFVALYVKLHSSNSGDEVSNDPTQPLLGEGLTQMKLAKLEDSTMESWKRFDKTDASLSK